MALCSIHTGQLWRRQKWILPSCNNITFDSLWKKGYFQWVTQATAVPEPLRSYNNPNKKKKILFLNVLNGKILYLRDTYYISTTTNANVSFIHLCKLLQATSLLGFTKDFPQDPGW